MLNRKTAMGTMDSQRPGGIRNTAATVRDSAQVATPRPDVQSAEISRPEATNTGYREQDQQRSNAGY